MFIRDGFATGGMSTNWGVSFLPWLWHFENNAHEP